MKNCCTNFLFLCCLSGVVIFLILGIFTLTDNSFLIIENIKKDENGDFDFDEDTKKIAYLQYFIAAVFDLGFAILIYLYDLYSTQKSSNKLLNHKLKPTATEIETINNDIIKNKFIEEDKNDNIISTDENDNLITNKDNNESLIQNIEENKVQNLNIIESVPLDTDEDIIQNKGMTEKY